MVNKGSKGDFESAAKGSSGRAAPSADACDATDRECEPPRKRPDREGKPREPLHAFIVHFDAEPSSKPPPPDYPDQQV